MIIKLGLYKLIAYSPTHNQLLYRHTSIENSENFDLLFEGTSAIELPLEVGIEKIYFVKNNSNTEARIEYLEGRGVIICKRVLYQRNKLEPMKSSIPIDNEEPLTDADILNIYKKVEKEGLDYYSVTNENSDWTILC